MSGTRSCGLRPPRSLTWPRVSNAWTDAGWPYPCRGAVLATPGGGVDGRGSVAGAVRDAGSLVLGSRAVSVHPVVLLV